MMDGMPVVGFADFITKRSYADAAAESRGENAEYESAERNVKDIFADCVADLTSAGSNVVALVDRCESSLFLSNVVAKRLDACYLFRCLPSIS